MRTISPLRTRSRRPHSQVRGLRTCLAWGVHLYTALGLVAAAGIGVLLAQPEVGPDAYRSAFVLMLVATLIDATDGTLARGVKVKEVLPGFDGRRLDDLVDFLMYVFLPLLLIWRAGILRAGHEAWLLLPLLAGAYGFSQVSAKTDDGYFLGFPSYWNLVAFYLYILPLPGWLCITLVVGFSLLTFVPLRYLYPTQRGKLNQLTNLLGIVWTALLIWILWRFPGRQASTHDSGNIALISLFFPIYYLAASWLISLKFWRTRRRARVLELQSAAGTR